MMLSHVYEAQEHLEQDCWHIFELVEQSLRLDVVREYRYRSFLKLQDPEMRQQKLRNVVVNVYQL